MKKQYFIPKAKHIQLDAEALMNTVLGGSSIEDAENAMTHTQEPVIEETNSPW